MFLEGRAIPELGAFGALPLLSLAPRVTAIRTGVAQAGRPDTSTRPLRSF
jgi:hypothetical protein